MLPSPGRFRPLLAVLLWSAVGVTQLGAQELSPEEDQILAAHNRWRARHQVPPLAWSPDLARYAQAWAEVLVTSFPGLLLHSEGADGVRPEAERLGYGGWGENLSWTSAVRWSDGQVELRTDWTPETVVDGWGSEVVWYDFATGDCAPDADPGCGHFTQLVWRGSATVGCGRAVGDDKAQVWVCSYDPPGNWTDEYTENVRPPTGG